MVGRVPAARALHVAGIRRSYPVGDRLRAVDRRALCDTRQVRVDLPVRDKPAEERVCALPVLLREDVRARPLFF